jgi:Flp pilus assembly protein TadD
MGQWMLKGIAILMLAALVALGSPAQLEQADKYYERTDYDAVLKLLLPLENKDGATLLLIGKSYYMKSDFKKASEWLEKAVGASPTNSQYWDWLGKAYGRRAETSSFLTAPHYAGKTRDAFEKAVDLDPKNVEALDDLFEYYLSAPGFLGGGFDKAAALAQRIKEVNPAEYHYVQAKLAEKRKEYGIAERQLRLAAELAPKQVGRLIDLAKFFAKEGRVKESDETFQEAEKIAPNSPKLMFARAETYIETNRNLDEARTLLERYLASNLTPDDPPREDAERLLRRVNGSGG